MMKGFPLLVHLIPYAISLRYCKSVDQLMKFRPNPQDRVAYVSFFKESGHGVVQAKVHSGINTLLLRSKFCLVLPFQVFSPASSF